MLGKVWDRCLLPWLIQTGTRDKNALYGREEFGGGGRTNNHVEDPWVSGPMVASSCTAPWAYPELRWPSQGVEEWEGTGQLNKIPFIF